MAAIYETVAVSVHEKPVSKQTRHPDAVRDLHRQAVEVSPGQLTRFTAYKQAQYLLVVPVNECHLFR